MHTRINEFKDLDIVKYMRASRSNTINFKKGKLYGKSVEQCLPMQKVTRRIKIS